MLFVCRKLELNINRGDCEGYFVFYYYYYFLWGLGGTISGFIDFWELLELHVNSSYVG